MNVRINPDLRSPAGHLAALLIVSAVGCSGPTHTAGTKGLAAKELSVLSIPQLPKEAHLQIHTVQFDGGGDQFEIGKSRDFYLAPANHTASFTLTANIPSMGGPAGWMMPKHVTLPGPKDVPLGVLTAAKTYELALPTEGFDQLMETGEIFFVREKAK